MVSTRLRTELRELLSATACTRPPALRRSLQPDWMYATDAPGLCAEAEKNALLYRLAEAGWETREEHDWLQIRKPLEAPPDPLPEGMTGPEAARCRSLLDRHPERDPSRPDREICLLVKAAEEGREAYEASCGKLRREWAERLRRKERLPDLSLQFFEETKEEETCCPSISATRNS